MYGIAKISQSLGDFKEPFPAIIVCVRLLLVKLWSIYPFDLEDSFKNWSTKNDTIMYFAETETEERKIKTWSLKVKDEILQHKQLNKCSLRSGTQITFVLVWH